ncbi:HAD family hydrolase, partial [Aliivibrio finisterrensis]
MQGGIMKKAYLFDWGDTLMVDFPNTQGKMCDWETVQAVDGALEMLASLSQKGHLLYVATGADDSCVQDIELAFE